MITLRQVQSCTATSYEGCGHGSEDFLVVATHGRSFWILDDLTPLRQIDGSAALPDLRLYHPQPAYRLHFPMDVNRRRPVGNNPPDGRVPRVRANVLASYRPTPPWMMSLGIRHSGKMYGQLDNSDFNGNVYGGVSSFTVADARVSYAMEGGADLAVGVDNLTDQHYYQFHPFPGRTLFAEMRWSYGATP